MHYLIDATAGRKSGALTDYLCILPALDGLLAGETCTVLCSVELARALANGLRCIQLVTVPTRAGLSRFVALNTSIRKTAAGSTLPNAILYGLFASRNNHVPYLIRFTNATLVDPAYTPCLRFLSLDERIAHSVRQHFLRRAIRNSAQTICSTQSAADLLLNWALPGVGSRVTASHFGPPDFNGHERKHVAPRNRRLLTMHIMPHKNIELILEAMARPELKGWTLTVMGDLHQPRNLYERFLAHKVRELGLSNRIQSSGFVTTREQVMRQMLQHDMLIIPSRTETWSHPVMEAMAIGMPVIASDIATHREVTQGGAWLVDVDQPQRLADTIGMIGECGSEVRARVQTGLDVVAGLSWQRHATDLLHALRLAATSLRRVRILLLSQWYDPEPNIKSHLLARDLLTRGHQVTAVTGFPNYPTGKVYPGYRVRWRQWEWRDGVRVLRVPLYPEHSHSGLKRVLNYASFAASASMIGSALCGGADVMWVYHPPLTVGIPAWWIGLLRRVPFVYEVQDMWPETLAATGMVSSGRVAGLVGRLAQFIYARAAAITVISPGFKRNLIEKGVPAGKIHIIPNWADEDIYRPVERDTAAALAVEHGLTGHFNVMFAGVMGPAQALENVLTAAEMIADCRRVQFVFIGDGIQLEQ